MMRSAHISGNYRRSEGGRPGMADDERGPNEEPLAATGERVPIPVPDAPADAGWASDHAQLRAPDVAPGATRAVATGADGATPAPSAQLQPLAFSFTGRASEYTRIWLVNTCLSVLTLGVFSAWAKVRTKRYLYSHTVLDGTPFEYLGRPLPILKGRLVAAALFTVWYVATHFITELLPAALVAAIVLAPWVTVQSLAFNARYSAYRNMTFQFHGGYWPAARVIGAGLLLTPLTLGAYFPVFKQRLQRFAAHHTTYGGVQAKFGAEAFDFFVAHFLAGLLFGMPAFVGAAVAAVWLGPTTASGAVFLGIAWSSILVMSAYIRAEIDCLVWKQLSLGPLSFRYDLTTAGLLWLYVSNLVAIAATCGVMIPWAIIRTARYRADRFRVFITGDMNTFRAREAAPVRAAGAELGEFFDLDLSL